MELTRVNLGKRIAALRQRRGLTQRALAARLSISAQAVHYWECGHRAPNLERLDSVASALDVTRAELLEGEPEHAATK